VQCGSGFCTEARCQKKVAFSINSRICRPKSAENVPITPKLLVEEGQVYLGSTAALRVARLLGGGWPLLYSLIIIPKGLRDLIYQWIGKHRYQWFGRRVSCRMPTALEKSHFLNEDHPLLK
jgi:predicted DCC family thiol-disulfide oxidoreductase YuxK